MPLIAPVRLIWQVFSVSGNTNRKFKKQAQNGKYELKKH